VTIPDNSGKEVFVTVENEFLTVAISPPVLDAVIVTGAAPLQSPNTIVFDSYDSANQELTLKSFDGALTFIIGSVSRPV
jgi:hypothetical protein